MSAHLCLLSAAHLIPAPALARAPISLHRHRLPGAPPPPAARLRLLPRRAQRSDARASHAAAERAGRRNALAVGELDFCLARESLFTRGKEPFASPKCMFLLELAFDTG
ncbi:unnamed protein product [Urochloa humidicola]